ncbi:VOC family protein [Algoriphagus namhaensis]|uniref:VOC family protein n=1 Tax=Algoriphagus namhaensis TaxID=915353 RepID=A0ABV8ALZ7_9BACT
MNIYSYLTFDGQAEEAMKFYQSILGGEFPQGFMYMRDMPDAPPMSTEDGNRVMHATLQLSDTLRLMGSDTFPGFGGEYRQGNQAQVYLDLNSMDETKRVFDHLSADGQLEMPLEKTFWGSYFGSFTDKYGICWMVSYDLKPGEE